MYIFFNPNNRNKAAGDCVIRAICAAEGKDWDTVYDELCFEGRYSGNSDMIAMLDEHARNTDNPMKRREIESFMERIRNM